MPAQEKDIDLLLIEALRQGDDSALAKLYDKYWMKLLSIAINRLNDENDAEECVQDVFIGLWRVREKLTITHTLAAYLSTAVRNQVMTRLASRYAKKQNPQLQLKTTASESADARILERDLSLEVENAIAKLPEKCQLVYRMSRMEGKANKIIAAELNISEKTVEGHITRAIQELRSRLLSGGGIVLWSIMEWYTNSGIKIK